MPVSSKSEQYQESYRVGKFSGWNVFGLLGGWKKIIYGEHSYPNLMKPVPIESSQRDLSIGTGFIGNGLIFDKIWPGHFGDQKGVTQNEKIKVLHPRQKCVTPFRKKCYTPV